jgi:dolichol-phosphate mannosyltransferase
MQTLIIIPTYNERQTIAELVLGIVALSPSFIVLVVDDSSPDGTAKVVLEIAQQNPRIRLLSRPSKQGLGTAYIVAFRYALQEGFQRIVTMDADFSHNPAALPSLVNTVNEWDVVIGSRYVQGGRIERWPWFRRQLSSIANLLTRRLLGGTICDWTSGYRCYRGEVIAKLPFDDIRANGYSFLVEVLAACVSLGCRVTELPITFSDRRGGQSKLSRWEIYKAMLTLLRLSMKKFLRWIGRRRPPGR